MSQIKVEVKLDKAPVPVGLHAAAFLFVLSHAGLVIETKQALTADAVSFEVTEPGEYTVTASRVLSNGSLLAEPVSASVTIEGDADVPASITLTLV